MADVTLTAGSVIGSYLNKSTMGGDQLSGDAAPQPAAGYNPLPVRAHSLSPHGVTDVIQVKTRREYYQIEWPLRTRQWESGVYYSGVLAELLPAGLRGNLQHRQRLKKVKRQNKRQKTK